MSAGTLAEVLAGHVQVSGFDEIDVWHAYGCACSWTGASDADHHAHVAAAVQEWLAARLASEEVREAVGRAINAADDEALQRTNFEYLSAAYAEQATAALTAVTAALREGAS